MAHLCPSCGEYCLCSNDTNGIVRLNTEYQRSCIHCRLDEEWNDEDQVDEFYGEESETL